MSILVWIEERRKIQEEQRKFEDEETKKKRESAKKIYEGLWTCCESCGMILYVKHLKKKHSLCDGCGFHLQMTGQERIDLLIDSGSWRSFNEKLSPRDPLNFFDEKSYLERLKDSQKKTGLQDGIKTGTAFVEGIPVALAVMDFNFMGGSMGSVIGEKITRLIEYASHSGLPLVIVAASGGARMQEGVLSLMQMGKISAALHVYQKQANLLFISILTSPTTGGVTASFGMLGDFIFSEPNALIGFAGRRVIEQTLQEDLPKNFQTSEYLLNHGLLDSIVPRHFLREALRETINFHKKAPFKKVGYIKYGFLSSFSFFFEEKTRRKWFELKKKFQKKNFSSFETDLLFFKKEKQNFVKFFVFYKPILLSFEKLFTFFKNQFLQIKEADIFNANSRNETFFLGGKKNFIWRLSFSKKKNTLLITFFSKTFAQKLKNSIKKKYEYSYRKII